ncbi:MAG: methyltransferase domain-containing protein [Phycisphaerae bacterium]|nr:methyltransferase domain-containing protein [Phycisphaerae bacterium]
MSGSVADTDGRASRGSTQDRLLLDRYDRWADHYDVALGQYSKATLAMAVRLLEPLPRRILDVACGTGLLTESLAAAFRRRQNDPAGEPECRPGSLEVIGIDVSESMLRKARERVRSYTSDRVRARFYRGRAEEIPLPDHSMQAIVIANAFHLIRDPEASLAECRRVLVPGGSLVVIDWCRDFLSMRALAWLLRATQRLQRRVETSARMLERIRQAGFTVQHGFRFRVRPAWGLMAFRALLPTCDTPSWSRNEPSR